MRRFVTATAWLVIMFFAATGLPVSAAAPLRAIYAAPNAYPAEANPGQSFEMRVRIDRKNLPASWTRIRVEPTGGIQVKNAPTWTKGNEIHFTVHVRDTAKAGEAKINLSLVQAGLTARLPLPFRIAPPMVPKPSGPVTVPATTASSACAIFPANNPWNQDISKALVHWNSGAYVSAIGLTHTLHPDFGENQGYGIPVTVAGTSTKDVPVRFREYADESDMGPYPIPSDARIEAGSDAHLIILSLSRCKLYELFAAKKEQGGWAASSGAIFDLRSNALRPAGWTSADAAGLPIYPGLVKYEEVAAGKILHAIRFTAPRTQDAYIHPATHQAGSANPNLPPMGLRLRLKQSYDISKLSGQAKVIAEAMKTYGLILADNGSPWFFQGATDPRWKDEELNQLKTIPGSAFEAVETGPLL